MSNFVTVTSDKSKWVAFFICLFTGMFGGHYYYVGRWGRGVLYTFTCGLLIFGWLHDLKLIFMGKFQDNIGQYLRK